MPCKEFMQARNEKYALPKTIAEISSASFLLHEICKLLTFERTRGFPRTRLCWWWWGRGYRWSPRTWGCLPILFKPRMEGNKNEPKKNQVFLDQPNEHCTGLRGFALEPVECASHTPLGQGQIWVRPWRCTEIQTFRIFDKKSLTGFSDHVFTHPILLLLPQINPLLSHPELPPEVLDILDATLCSNGEQLGGEDLPHARHSGLL